MFCTTSMPVGGAETLLVNLIQGLDRGRFTPELCCLKQPGPLGEELAGEIPVHSQFTSGRYDPLVPWRLRKLFRRRQTDTVVTVGAGDKMFWGRLAARWAGVPVICSALHSTGWPDGVGRLNRLLTPITDAFIGVARAHGEHLVQGEGFPREKVVVIPNGVDTGRFRPGIDCRQLREELGIGPTDPVVGIVAALRPEKNHAMFLNVAARLLARVPEAVFVLVGDGPLRQGLERQALERGISSRVRFLGTRNDTPELFNLFHVTVLTSNNEANPVSILESLACGTPLVATDVGSVAETVVEGETGYLVPTGGISEAAERISQLIGDPLGRQEMGRHGRDLVRREWSLTGMVRGYEELLERLFCRRTGQPRPQRVEVPTENKSWEVLDVGS